MGIYSTLNNGVEISRFMKDRVKDRYAMAGTYFKLLAYVNNIKFTTALIHKISFLYGISADLLHGVCLDNF